MSYQSRRVRVQKARLATEIGKRIAVGTARRNAVKRGARKRKKSADLGKRIKISTTNDRKNQTKNEKSEQRRKMGMWRRNPANLLPPTTKTETVCSFLSFYKKRCKVGILNIVTG